MLPRLSLFFPRLVRAPAPVSFRVPHGSWKRFGSTKAAAPTIDALLDANKKWAKSMTDKDPEFFSRLANQQKPKYLWIGCSDSRVPANQILGLSPGEVFVHRNIANMVVNTDLNILSVLQFAVEVLKVEHIIVTGHYNCGGVQAALKPQSLGLIDNWLRNIRDVARLHKTELEAIEDEPLRARRLVELNVKEQAMNVFKTGIVQKRHLETKAEGGRALPRVHALVYSLEDGILKTIPLDEADMFQKYSSVYNLFPEGALKAAAKAAAPAAAGKHVHGPDCGCGK